MYTNVVSTEMIHIALMIVALNNFEVKSADILKAYVKAPVTEKVWTAIAMYGLKSAGAAFTSYLVSCMESIGYLPHWADWNVWMRAEIYQDDRKNVSLS